MEAIEDWYEAQQTGLGGAFRSAVDRILADISDYPLMYPQRYRDNRRAVLRRFPCLVWYRVLEDSVVVLACVHGKRDPRRVQARLRQIR